MRNSNEQSLGEVIKQLLKAYRFEDKINAVRIHSIWLKVMGQPIHQLTENMVLKNGVLIVYLRSATLRQELSMGKSKIISMLNKEIGKNLIKEIVFK